MQVNCNFLRANRLNTNPPKATFYCKLQCFLHLRSCLKTPQKSANQNLELSPPPPTPPPSLSVILPSATALSVINGKPHSQGPGLKINICQTFVLSRLPPLGKCVLTQPRTHKQGSTNGTRKSFERGQFKPLSSLDSSVPFRLSNNNANQKYM